MATYENPFSNIKDGDKLFVSFDANYLVVNGGIDSRIIQNLIKYISVYGNIELTINDSTCLLNKVLKKISYSKPPNITVTSEQYADIDYSKYDKIFIIETLKDQIERVLNQKKYCIDIICFPTSFPLKLLYAFHGELYETIEQEFFFPEIIKKIIHRNSVNEEKNKSENIIVLDCHIRNFYIGDTCLWLSSIRQIQLKFNSRVTIACENPMIYKKICEIFTEAPFPTVQFKIFTWDTLNLEDFDTIICHQDSILPFLQLYKKKPKLFAGKKIYRFAPNAEFKNLKITYLWDINRYFKTNHRIEDGIRSIQQLKKQIHREIYLSEEEIKEADLWLNNNGYVKEEKIVILFDESSHIKKALSFLKTISLIKLILSNPKNKILIFDYQDVGKKHKFKLFLTPLESSRIISANNLGIRKEMSIIANPAISVIIGPCTGMMHIANGIYTELLNNKRRSKQEIPTIIVYCGSGNDIDNYHPRYWWQGAIVKCMGITKNSGILKVHELYEMPIDIKEFHKNYLPVSCITPENIMSLVKT